MDATHQQLIEKLEAQQRLTREFAVLGGKLADSRTPREVAIVTLDAAGRLFGWDAAFLNLYSETEEKLFSVVTFDTIDGLKTEFPLDSNGTTPGRMSKLVLEKGAMLFGMRDWDRPEVKRLASFGDLTRFSKSLMFAPVRKDGRPIAVLSIQSYHLDVYTQDDLENFQALADHCGGALWRTYAETNLRAQEDRYHVVSEENRMLRKQLYHAPLKNPEYFADLITVNDEMRVVFHYVEAIAQTDQAVLISGETGVGKELLARAIHRSSGRKGPFIPVNIAGLDDEIFSDTLFGHQRGAFTGALHDRKGLIETASGGTLFLDEIGDLALASQIKLLRLLQEAEYYPLGSDKPKKSNARIITATNHDLDELLKKGQFRKDLYYRLQTHRIYIPPLRERRGDIPPLVEHFLQKAARSQGKQPPTVPREIYDLLGSHHFPGNIRELESMIIDAVTHHTAKVLSLHKLIERIGRPATSEDHIEPASSQAPIRFSAELPTLRQAGDLLVEEAMRRSANNQTQAARLLGITQQALSQRLKRRRSGKT